MHVRTSLPLAIDWYRAGVVGVPRLSQTRRSLLGLVLLMPLLFLVCVHNASAQGVDYNPTKTEGVSPDEADEEEEEKPNTVFSFGRFEKGIRSLCAELEVDQRRMRIFTLAQARAKDPTECPSCRAFWRSLNGSCRQVKKEPKNASTQKKKKKVKSEAPEEGAEADAAPTPEATPTPIPAARMPSTVVLDDASLLSNAFYDADPKRGGVFQAVSNFEKVLLSQKDLTRAEKDYYGILTTYLLSAWQGRELDASGASGASGAEKPGAKQRELEQLFE